METTTPLNAIRQQAAAWVVCLSEPGCGDTERAAFAAWRAASPAHDVAYEREAAAWDMFDRLRALRPNAAAPDPDLLASLAPHRDSGGERAPSRFRKKSIGWAIAAMLTFAAIGAGSWSVFSAPAYATAVGERRIVVLPDDSRVELNTDSEIVVHYNRAVREVSLTRGEAMFEVANDTRPFHVRARDAVLSTVSGKLNVRMRAEGTSVLVGGGAVRVEPVHAPALEATRLSVGEEALYSPNGDSVHTVSPREMDRRLAWRKSMIDLDGQSLAQAIGEFNRYNRRHIVIADESIGGMRLGGYFSTNDLDGFVRALRTAFPIKTGAGNDGSITLMRAD